MYSVFLGFSWDEKKSQANFRRRGFDFAFASRVFSLPTLVAEDRRRAYGERRFVAIGVVDGIELTVVYTDRQAVNGRLVRRIISARRSNQRERGLYADQVSGNTPDSNDSTREG